MFANVNFTEKKLKQNINEEQSNGILKRIIEVVCFLVANGLPEVKMTGKITINCNVLDIENVIQVMMVSKSCNTCGLIEKTTNIIRRRPEIIKKSIEAIAAVLKINLEKEMELCPYVSLILSKHPRNSKLFLILRYVHNGNICERFVGIIETMDTENIKRLILQLLADYKVASKLISFSCDGGLLTIENISNVLTSLQKISPSCIFAPCHYQDINIVLEQRLSNLEGCGNFFKILHSMKMFFQNNSRLCELLRSFCKRIPDLYNLKLSNAHFLIILKFYRRSFKAFFSHIAEKCGKLSNDELVVIKGFQYILEEYQIVFMIEAFYALFNRIAVLSDILNSGSPENAFDDNIVNSVEAALIKDKTSGFEHLWTLVIKELIKDCCLESLQSVGKNETDALLELYSRAVDCMIEEIYFRFKYVHKLEFLSILNCEAHDKLLISDYQMKQIKQIPEDFINKEKIIAEMKVLNKNGWIFGGKSVYELMEILTKMDLKNTFTNVYRLGEIILTLPCKPNLSSKNSSKIDVIESCIFENDAGMESINFLRIEKDYLEQLTAQTNFYDEVILKMHEMNQDLPAMIKNIKS